MSSRAWIATPLLLLAGCFSDFTGAPCHGDDNCPLGQVCGAAGKCVLGTPTDGGSQGGGGGGTAGAGGGAAGSGGGAAGGTGGGAAGGTGGGTAGGTGGGAAGGTGGGTAGGTGGGAAGGTGGGAAGGSGGGAAGGTGGGTAGGAGGAGGGTVDPATIAAPRQLAPLSTATTSVQTPTLKWSLPAGVDGAHVEVCAARDCATVVQSADVTGTSWKVPTALAPHVYFWRLAGRVGTVTGTPHSPTWEFFARHSSGVAGERDTSWGSFPDFNGDGYADVFLGSGQINATDLFISSAAGQAPAVRYFDARINDAGAWLGDSGIVPSQAFDTSTAVSAGDLDGDGYGDFAVTSRCVVPADQCPSGTGQVLIYRGGPSGPAASDAPSWTLDAPNGPATMFGWAVSTAGDFNDDGYADLVVSAVNWSTDAGVVRGRAYVFFGSATGPSSGNFRILDGAPAAGPNSGSLAGGCDFNADGVADVAISTGTGSVDFGVEVFTGGASASASVLLTTPAQVLAQSQHLSAFGRTVGDVTGDGLCDLVTVSWAEDAGTVFVYTGDTGLRLPTSDQQFDVLGVNQYFGSVLSIVGDVNGDGFDDVMIAAPATAFAGNPGTQYLFLGVAAGLDAGSMQVVAPTTGGEKFSLAEGAGDVDGDGYLDLVCAAFYTNVLNLMSGGPAVPSALVPLYSLIPPTSWWYVASIQ